MIDIHSHLLPGVDDGSQSLEDSVEIIRGLAEQGITDIIVTPHYIAETDSVSPRARNLELLDELRHTVATANLSVNLHLGNELYIDAELQHLLKSGTISPLADSSYILVELPMSGEYDDFEEILAELQELGWRVILAHPERYYAMQQDYNKLLDLHARGVLFQCNLGSIIGQYGKTACKTLKKLAKDNLIFAFGTDIHHQRDYREIAKAQKKLGKFYSAETLRLILEQNPRQIIESVIK